MFIVLFALAVVFVAHTAATFASSRYCKATQGTSMHSAREFVVSLLAATGPAFAAVSVITAFAFV